MNYWLIKTEPTAYSIDDLKWDKKTSWTGIRNYQARNFIRDGVKAGDKCLFYHSGTEPIVIYGVAKVISNPYPDPTQFDKKEKRVTDNFLLKISATPPRADALRPLIAPSIRNQAKSTKDRSQWFVFDVSFEKKFDKAITLAQIKFDPILKNMIVAKKGSRLSILPVSEEHFKLILDQVKKLKLN